MTKINKNSIVAMVLILLVMGIWGCGAEEPPPEPVTISFVHQEYETSYYEPLVEEFMQSFPEITVELTSIRGNNLDAYAKADVVRIDLFTFLQFQPQGAFLDLSPLIEQDKSFSFADFYPGTVDLFSLDERVWAIPDGIDPFVMYYNKDLFDLNGLEYPANYWTWEEMLSAAMVLRNEELNQFGYAVPNEHIEMNAMVLIYQHGGQIFNDLNNPTDVTLNDPLNIEAIDWFGNLYNRHNVAPTTEQANEAFGTGNQTLYRGILQGDIGMWPGNFSERDGRGWPVRWENISWGMVAMPMDKTALTSGFGTGYAISAQSQNREAAWQWVTFLSDQVPQNLVPARRSLVKSSDFIERQGEEVSAAALRSVETVTLISPKLVQFESSIAAFSQAVRSVVSGETSARIALDGAQEQFETP